MTSASTKSFRARPGSRVRQKDAERLGPILDRLAKRPKGCKPADLVNEAKPRRSPIHHLFEWDDHVAGARYRLAQARHLLGAVECVVIYRDQEGAHEETIRRFYNVELRPAHDGQPAERTYLHIERVQDSLPYSQQVEQDAARQLQAWANRHRQYKSLRAFRRRFGAILEMIEDEEPEE